LLLFFKKEALPYLPFMSGRRQLPQDLRKRHPRPQRELRRDGTEIEGNWSILGHWSGKFLMIRATGLTQARQREVKVRV